MAKRKPPQPQSANMLVDRSADNSPPPNGFTEDYNWSSAEETNADYARLDNQLRDFVYGISRGYSVRHSCRMSGEDYELMLDYLNNRSNLFKPDLLKLVDKARAVAQARHIEKLNASPDWHAAAFWLERRAPKEFAPPRMGGANSEDAEERKALIRMSAETLDALSAAYDSEHGSPEEERE